MLIALDKWIDVSEKTTGLGFSRGLLLEPYLTGCFPPKPPVRSLIHSDHRRPRQKQQEYRGNKREDLYFSVALRLANPHKCGEA